MSAACMCVCVCVVCVWFWGGRLLVVWVGAPAGVVFSRPSRCAERKTWPNSCDICIILININIRFIIVFMLEVKGRAAEVYGT